MKTNITMLSTDRNLFGVTIRQQTKDGFFSVSDLQRAYEAARWQYGWSDRKVADILATQTTKERVYHLLKERDLIKADISVFMEMVEHEGIVKVLKGLNTWKVTGRGDNKAVYTDPYIWILLALDLNPLLYAKVVIWITDSLLFDRIEAGNEFLPMNTSIKEICGNDKDVFMNTAIAINKKVFGRHQTGMRNLASAKQLKQITDIEKFIAQSISAGFIKTQQEIITAIEKFHIKEPLLVP